MNKNVLCLTAMMAAFFLVSGCLQAQGSGNYQAGTHYTVIENAPKTAGDTVEVAEAFSYLCTHCATFEPYIDAWHKRQESNVKFRRIPVGFGRDSWMIYARAYTTAELMGIADAAHGPLMDKLWKKREVLRSLEDLADFYADFGVNPATFVATSKSFATDARVRKNERALIAANVRSTPNVIVAGKYLVKNNDVVNNYDKMLKVIDFLVATELSELAAAAAAKASQADEGGQAETGSDEQS